MTFDVEIKLINPIGVKDEVGDTIETENKRSVLASIVDYRSKSYYQALSAGLKPSISFGINKYEYQGEKTLEYNNEKYKIVDAYPISQKNKSEYEGMTLLCEKVI